MARKLWIYFFLAILTTVVIGYLNFRHQNDFLYTFINQTDDHRFDESIMTSILAANTKTQTDNTVVILPSTPKGFNISSYANSLFQKLSVGKQYHGRGILYLFVPSEHKLKIEVSYSLESTLPDVSLRSLEEAAKTFIYSDRYQDFWAELIITVNRHINRSSELTSYDFDNFKYLSGGAGRTSLQYNASKEQLASELKLLPPGPEQYRHSSTDITRALELYLQSLHDGIYDINLGMLDLNSKLFRIKTPLTMANLQRNYEMMNQTGVDKIITTPQLAFVFFKQNEPVLPLVFRQNKQHEWLIQEPLSWSLFHRFEDSDQVFLKYPIKTENHELTAYLNKTYKKPIYYFADSVNIDQLNDLSADWMIDYFLLYDIESFRDKLSSLPLATRLDIQTNLGLFTDFLLTYKQIILKYPNDSELKKNYDFYKQVFTFDNNKWRRELL